MNVGIHFTNRQWGGPREEDYQRLRLCKPECIKTLLYTQCDFDQAAVHRRIHDENPGATIVARLSADMQSGPWEEAAFVASFRPQIDALQGIVTWFEVHNEPNLDASLAGYSEGFGPTPSDFARFDQWIGSILPALKANHPWARWVFPGNAPHNYDAFWQALLPRIQEFDAWAVHCYWQGSNHVHRDFGRSYERAHELLPAMPLIITEWGDSTVGRTPDDKIPFYLEWSRHADQQPYILGTALYMIGPSADWQQFEITAAMAQALGSLPRTTAVDWGIANVVDGFDFPVSPPDGAGYYIAAGLLDESYFDAFGSWHTGEDWNDIRLGDSDLGAPVYAVAHGQVITAQHFPVWGNIILIEHNLADGRQVWSQYAHLRDMQVAKGDSVRRGDPIGTIGKGADDRYAAHLHFEIRTRRLAASKAGWRTEADRDQVVKHYAHPTEFINAHRPGWENIWVSVDDTDPNFSRTTSAYWQSQKAGYGGHSWWTWTVSDQEDCVATWQPSLTQDGLYEVLAHIPSRNATSRQAPYTINHLRGTDTVTISQMDYYDEWASLGTYVFGPSQPVSVRLADMTGEPYTREKATRKQVAFDAMLWVRVGSETNQPPSDIPDTDSIPPLPWPTATDGFDYPINPPSGQGFYVRAGMLEPVYKTQYGVWHTGEDWQKTNDAGGESIYAIANGRVVTAQRFSEWGTIILLEHLLPDGETIWSQYSSLAERHVKRGDVVRRGQPIGTVGTCDHEPGPAHLHLEIRRRELPASKWGWTTEEDRQAVSAGYMHPSAFIATHRPGHSDAAIVVDDQQGALIRNTSPYWHETIKEQGGRYWWTYTVSEQQGEDCVVTWQTPLVKEGLYAVFAYVPGERIATKQARYQISHRRGTDTVSIAQSDFAEEWAPLGTYAFAAGLASVRLSDLTGEPYTRDPATRKLIQFDALCWVPVSDT